MHFQVATFALIFSCNACRPVFMPAYSAHRPSTTGCSLHYSLPGFTPPPSLRLDSMSKSPYSAHMFHMLDIYQACGMP
ncbi:hypothetical protein PF010_g5674 [Phytophthora fragariae]|uniref:Secreted protein n=1 Tax=Phytophthora fragariae TaxID=53985 RepID=A0A6G0LNI0_9STRA|nr:hypothetical protein PF010_g5674 [Phytophthora fragariae]KAE9208264.1 hypothetical protein PF004_g16814 [Phytophthora fragariae]